MASVRDLKKDIDYLVYEIISDCFSAMVLSRDEKTSDKLAEIISGAVILRNDLFARARYRGEERDPAVVRNYYRELRSELRTEVDRLFKRLIEVVKE